jgi:hypothetical protein
MKPRLRFVFGIIGGGVLAAAACDLNPQPLPPLAAEGPPYGEKGGDESPNATPTVRTPADAQVESSEAGNQDVMDAGDAGDADSGDAG